MKVFARPPQRAKFPYASESALSFLFDYGKELSLPFSLTSGREKIAELNYGKQTAHGKNSDNFFAFRNEPAPFPVLNGKDTQQGGKNMTDQEIVALFWARSETAIEETGKSYGRYCHAIAAGILRDDGEAQEIVNDAYLKAWNSIPPEKPEPFKGFLGRIVRQLSLNRLEYREAQKRGDGQRAVALEELEECLAEREEGDPLDRIALRDALSAFLRSQPDLARRVFIRRYWYMDPVAEIARAFAISESRVKSLLMRQREKLRKYLSGEGIEV